MGRSSQEQALQNRSRIVENASRLFRRFGVDNVSVADVMTATGMTIGGFYKHFESKDALVQEAFSLAFKQASAAWHHVSDRRYHDPGLRSGAIVHHYFHKRPPDQTCPMLAFAPHLTAEAPDRLSLDTYRKGAEELFTQFLDHMSESQTGDDAAPISNRDTKVLFAAMVGAGFLARATGDAKWVRSVQDAIESAATAAAGLR